MKPQTPAALAEGLELFNRGEYFDAHEVWEDAWRVEEGVTRQLLQALILVAAGCHKASLGEARGTVKLLGSAVTKLVDLADGEAGLALGAFRGAVLEALVHAQAWESGGAVFVPHLQLERR